MSDEPEIAISRFRQVIYTDYTGVIINDTPHINEPVTKVRSEGPRSFDLAPGDSAKIPGIDTGF